MFITRYELNELLSHSQILIEEDTLISDKIRLLKIKNDLIIQEKSNKDEFIIRYSITKNDAEKFITERMSIYNKMWDGCGCKIDYYSQLEFRKKVLLNKIFSSTIFFNLMN